MLSILDEVENKPYVYFGFDPKDENANNQWHATPIICTSENGIDWSETARLPQLGNLRDGYIKKINDYYWIAGTLYLYRTKDFVNFENFGLDKLNNDIAHDIWAPEFIFDDVTNSWKIIYSANVNGQRGLYLTDLNIETGEITNPYQKLNVPKSDVIDPDIIRYQGKYILVVSGGIFYTADKLTDKFVNLETNLTNQGGNWFEAPELLVADDKIFLYQDKITGFVDGVADSGKMVYATAKLDDLTNWTGNQEVNSNVNMRHGSFIYNGKKPTQDDYFPDIKPDSSLGTRLI